MLIRQRALRPTFSLTPALVVLPSGHPEGFLSPSQWDRTVGSLKIYCFGIQDFWLCQEM